MCRWLRIILADCFLRSNSKSVFIAFSNEWRQHSGVYSKLRTLMLLYMESEHTAKLMPKNTGTFLLKQTNKQTNIILIIINIILVFSTYKIGTKHFYQDQDV